LLQAIFIGSASDKTIPITTDTVKAVYMILGFPVPADAEQIAIAAEEVRDAILDAHGGE
jgi:hypothetical protein